MGCICRVRARKTEIPHGKSETLPYVPTTAILDVNRERKDIESLSELNSMTGWLLVLPELLESELRNIP